MENTNTLELSVKDCHGLSRNGQEAEVRAALTYVLEQVSISQAIIDDLVDNNINGNALRKQRSVRNQWRLAVAALRTRISVLNQQRKANIQPRTKIEMNTNNLGQLIQVAQALNGLKGSRQKVETESIIPQYRPVTDDPIADASIAAIKAKYEAGISLKEQATKSDVQYNPLLDALKTIDSRERKEEEMVKIVDSTELIEEFIENDCIQCGAKLLNEPPPLCQSCIYSNSLPKPVID
jgi:hypothetical protein